MEFADYYVVPSRLLARVKKLYEAERIWAHENADWIVVMSSDRKLPAKLDVAMHFRDDEGAAWGFTLWVDNEEIASALYGENMETGVSEDDNFFDGDVASMAKALDVDAKKLAKILEPAFPDSGKFAKLVGFPFLPVSASEADRALEKQKREKKKRGKPKKKAKRRGR